SRWLRSGAAGELGFTAGEVSGFERLTVLGGTPLDIFPLAPPPTTYAPPEPEPEVTEREIQAYAGWIRGRTGADAPLLDVGQAPSTPARGLPGASAEGARAARTIAELAATLRRQGATIAQLRVAPGVVFLSITIPRDPAALSNAARAIADTWTLGQAEARAGIEITIKGGFASQSDFWTFVESVERTPAPPGVRLTIRPR